MYARRCAPALVGRLGPSRPKIIVPTISAKQAPSLTSIRPTTSSLYPSLFNLNGNFSPSNLVLKRWATKKAAGVSNNNRKSNPKYLGIKKGHGELVIKGNIILRQRGTEFHPKGDGIGLGKDHTLFAKADGRVKFSRIRLPKPRRFVSVVPHDRVSEAFPQLRLPAEPPVLSPPSKRTRKIAAYEAKLAPPQEIVAVTWPAIGAPRPAVRAGPKKFARPPVVVVKPEKLKKREVRKASAALKNAAIAARVEIEQAQLTKVVDAVRV